MKTTVYDMNGNSVGEIELNDAIFALEPNVSVMHTVVKNYLANQRQGTQSALTRSYRYTVNKKVRKLAIKSALSTKASAQKLIVIDAIKFDAPKTKAFAAFMSAVNASAKSLVVTAAPDQNVALSGRNLPGVKTTMANMINTYDILKYDTLVVDKASLTVIEEVFA